jgi:hypothetical protein
MKMMDKPWINVYHARSGIETKVTLCASLFGEEAARSVRIGISNKDRANPQHGCDRAVRHFASGFVDRDVTSTEDNSSRIGRSL